MTLATIVLTGLLLLYAVTAQSPTFDGPPPAAWVHGYQHAAAAVDNGQCSEVGRNLMILGGNYIDAIVGIGICQEVMDPHSCGIGGGSFITLYNKKNKTCTVVDSREMAPLRATQDMYVKNPDLSKQGWLAIAVPGHLSGMWTVHSLGGKLPWAKCLAPSIALLRDGAPVSGSLAESMARYKKDIVADPTMTIFINPATKDTYKEGEILKRPDLANTLERLANATNAEDLFYRGDLAKEIVAEMTKDSNGTAILSLNDFANYKAIIRKDVITLDLPNYGLTICGPPPPSGAAVTLGIVNIMDGYKFNVNSNNSEPNADFFQVLIEALKFAYAARQNLSDISFNPDALNIANRLTSVEWAQLVRSMINNQSHPYDYYAYQGKPPMLPAYDHGTSHMNAIDGDGNVASMTMSVNAFFGSMRRSIKLGIVWNNEMDDFSTPGAANLFGFQPSVANYIAPGKRPQSSMSPVVGFDTVTGQPRISIGAEGGSRIISTVAQVIVRCLFLNESMQGATNRPRLHNQYQQPDKTDYDAWFPTDLLQQLKAKGQNMVPSNPVEDSILTAIKVESNGEVFTSNDPRKAGGFSAGFKK